MPAQMKAPDVRISVEPLTQKAFAPFGLVIQNPTRHPSSWSQKPESVLANQGSATKYLDISQLTNHYHLAPSKKSAKPIVNMFVSSPRQLQPAEGTGSSDTTESHANETDHLDSQHPEFGGAVSIKDSPSCSPSKQGDSEHPEFGGVQPTTESSRGSSATSSKPDSSHPEFGGAQPIAEPSRTSSATSSKSDSSHPEFGGVQPTAEPSRTPSATSSKSDSSHPEFGGAQPSGDAASASDAQPSAPGAAQAGKPAGQKTSQHALQPPSPIASQLAQSPHQASSQPGPVAPEFSGASKSVASQLAKSPHTASSQPGPAAPEFGGASKSIVAQLAHSPHAASSQPSPAAPEFSGPGSTTSTTLQSPTQKSFQVSILERHPYTPQTFIPLGLSPTDTGSSYLVIVAPTQSTSSKSVHGMQPKSADLPSLSGLRAFVADGSQAVTYGPGTWHAPMVVLGERSVDFVVVQFANGVGEEDCQEVELKAGGEGLRVVLDEGVGSIRAKL